MQVVVNNLLTNYQEVGNGKTVLLLHGWGDNSLGLSGFAKELSSKYRVVSLDLPGFGGSESPTKTWGLSDYANFVSQFLTKINIEPYAIIGHSNGGAIVMRGISFGLKAKKLVLLASAGIRGEYKGRTKLLRYLTKAGKAVTYPFPKKIKKNIRQKVYKTVGSDMLVAEHLQETFKKVIEDDVREDSKKIKVPTLLIYGEKDESTPVRYGQILNSNIKGSKLIIIPDAGHMLPTENTSIITKLTLEFLND